MRPSSVIAVAVLISSLIYSDGEANGKTAVWLWLKDRATVDAPMVTLGDVATVRGGPEQTLSQLSALNLGATPGVGNRRRIGRAELNRVIARSFGDAVH